MWVLGLYRLYVAMAAGIGVWLLWNRRLWAALLAAILVRATWALIELRIRFWQQERNFANHIGPFKQLLGPYGIRMANKAESDRQIRTSLAEVFTSNNRRLQEVVKQLEMMDTLFRAGMRPEGDVWLLHDCKLKYARDRLAREESA